MDQLHRQTNLNEVQTRQQALHELETDVGEVYQVYKDLARIVRDGDEVIDSIEANIGQTALYVEQGQAYAQQALQYKTKSRRKKLAFILVVVVAISLVIALTCLFRA